MWPHERTLGVPPPAREALHRRHRGALGRGMEPAGHLPVRPDRPPGARVLDRHPAAHRVRVAARGSRVLVHPHRPDRPLPPHARAGGVLPHGVGRQRPADRAPRAELLRRAMRSVVAVRRGLRATGGAGQGAGPDLPPQLHRAVRAAHAGGREGVRGALHPTRAVRGLDPVLPDHRRQRPGRVPAGLPAQHRPRRGLPGRGTDPVGRDVPDRGGAGRARGPREAGGLPPHRVPPPRR